MLNGKDKDVMPVVMGLYNVSFLTADKLFIRGTVHFLL